MDARQKHFLREKKTRRKELRMTSIWKRISNWCEKTIEPRSSRYLKNAGCIRVINQSVTVDSRDGLGVFPFNALTFLERRGRVCYKSERKITPDSAENFLRKRIEQGHTSILEHLPITVKLITSRGVSHELVRHRIASYSQESTRYCNYGNTGLTFILPPWARDFPEDLLGQELSVDACEHRWLTDATKDWLYFLFLSAGRYNTALNNYGWKPEQARGELPHDLKTEVDMTCNIRAWQEIFQQRLSVKAHPQMRELMGMVLELFRRNIPLLFDSVS